jgi:DNA-binding response OmpR family regulator
VKNAVRRQEGVMNRSKQRILIVDDNIEMLKLLLRGLGAHYEIVVAPNPYDMEIMLHHFEPHLIILDLALDGEDGADVCFKIRYREEYDQIGIMILSGLDEPRVAAAAIRGGADSYMTKPFDIHTLQSTISHVIQMKALSAGKSAPVVSGQLWKDDSF